MKRWMMLVAAWALAVPLHATQRVATVPTAFQGEWNTNAEHCGTALNDSRLRIGSNTISFYESQGPVRAVVVQGSRELALIAELSGEGQRWLSLSHYRLDPSGRKLTDVSDEAHPVVRTRCPKR